MSKISRCPNCGGNIVTPAFPGDGDYPVSPMCHCDDGPPAGSSYLSRDDVNRIRRGRLTGPTYRFFDEREEA